MIFRNLDNAEFLEYISRGFPPLIRTAVLLSLNAQATSLFLRLQLNLFIAQMLESP
jgi:hypothetical protein